MGARKRRQHQAPRFYFGWCNAFDFLVQFSFHRRLLKRFPSAWEAAFSKSVMCSDVLWILVWPFSSIISRLRSSWVICPINPARVFGCSLQRTFLVPKAPANVSFHRNAAKFKFSVRLHNISCIFLSAKRTFHVSFNCIYTESIRHLTLLLHHLHPSTYIYIYINCTYSFCAIYIIYSVPQKEHRKVFFRMLRPERRQENLDPTSWNPTGKHEPHFWKKFRNKNHANMEDSRMHAESTYSWEMLKMKSPNEKLDPIIYTCQVYKEVKDIGKLGENNQALAHRANAICFVGT